MNLEYKTRGTDCFSVNSTRKKFPNVITDTAKMKLSD